MAATHNVHRVMEENLFGAFQRQPSFGSFRSSLTASDLVSSQRRQASSVTGHTMPLQYKCRPSSDILQTQPTMRDKDSPEGNNKLRIHFITHISHIIFCSRGD